MRNQTWLAVFLLALLAVLPVSHPGWLKTVQSPRVPEVVINEIAWAGTAASSQDEWIELRNNTNRDVDLTGWTLRWREGEEEIVIHFGSEDDNTKEVRRTVIPARGFYLLERTDDETIRDIEADLIYTGALRNSGEELRLVDPEGNVVDTANLGGEGQGWPAGTTGDVAEGEVPFASMERVDPTAPDRPENWASNDGVIRNGRDAEGNLINGTPKAENSRKKTN